MSVEIGNTISNLIPGEPVTINQIQLLGSMVFIKYTGVNSLRANVNDNYL